MEHDNDKAMIDESEHHNHSLVALVGLEDLLKVGIQVAESHHEKNG